MSKVREAPPLFDDVPVVAPSITEVIDDLVVQIRRDIDTHREMEDVFRNRKWDEAAQYLAKASKLLRGE